MPRDMADDVGCSDRPRFDWHEFIDGRDIAHRRTPLEGMGRAGLLAMSKAGPIYVSTARSGGIQWGRLEARRGPRSRSWS